MNIPKPKVRVVNCCNARLLYCPGSPILVLYNDNFRYFPEGGLVGWHYFHGSKAKREPKYGLIEIVEAAKAMKNWIGIEPFPASTIGGLNECLCPQPSHVRNPTCYTWNSEEVGIVCMNLMIGKGQTAQKRPHWSKIKLNSEIKGKYKYLVAKIMTT